MDKIWTKDFILVSTANFIVTFVYYTLMIILAVYAMDEMGASPAEAGLAVGVLILSTMIARIFSGRYIEDIGRTKFMRIGAVVFAGGTVLYPFADTITQLIIVRTLHGIGFGCILTALGTLAAVLVPRKRQGEGLGYFLLSITLASAIGPLVAILMQENMTITDIFLLDGILAVVVYILTRFVTEQPPLPKQQRSVRASGWHAFFEPSAIPIGIVSFLMFLGYAGIATFFSPYMIELDLTQAGAFFFLAYSITILITRPFTGRLSDSKGLSFVLYPSCVFFAVSLAWLSIVTHGWEVLGSAVAMGLGFGAFVAAAQARAIRGLPNDRIGVATTTFMAISELGTGFGPFLFGLILPMIGYSGVYQLSAVICLVAGGVYYLFYSKK
ncbi:MAG: MFS transporter [Selenomonadales bacterium]|nr:MFS transporter [Selenomonadales bacterium]